ncbi:MAG: TonB-dependent receptor [Chitinophagales bacterium]|nr:TonB-dependent receptor [Chitinophagales bacterium]
MESAQSVLFGKLLLLSFCLTLLQLTAVPLLAQDVSISGQILSKTTGTTLPGTTVQAIGAQTTIVTLADENGKYSLTIPSSDSVLLQFSLIGFKKFIIRLSLNNKTNLTCDALLTEENLLLPQVEIEGGKMPERGTEGQTIEVITQQQLDQQAATNLKSGLQMVTGVTIIDNQINIRGSSGFNYGTGSRVLVLLNGMPAMNAERATVNFNLLATDNIERVEVLKGSASLRYGSSALGGVVNVIMDKPSDTPRTTIRFAQRFFLPPDSSVRNWEGIKNSYVSSLHFSRSQRIRKTWDFTAQGDLVRDAGYRNEEYNNRVRVLALNEWHNAFKRNRLTIGFNVQYLREQSAVFVFWKDYPNYTHEPGLNSLSRQTLDYVIADPSLKYISPNGNIYNLQCRFSWQNTESSTSLSGYSLQSWNEFTWSRQFKPWFSIIAGGNYQYSFSNPTNNPQGEASSQQFAQFGIATFRLLKSKFESSDYRIIITTGARFQYEKMFGDTFQINYIFQPEKLLTIRHPLAGFTINYQVLRFTRVRASITQGVRAASLNERFSNISLGGLRTNPAPNINPETGYSAEIGITQYFGAKGAASKFSGYLDAAAFLMRFQDMIEFLIDIPKSSLTNLSFKAQNLANVSIQGIEGNLGFRFEHRKLLIAYNGGVTLLQPVNYDGLKELDGDSATILVLNPPVGITDPDFYKYIRDVPYTLKYRSKITATQSLTIGWGIMIFTTNYRYLSRMENVDKLLLFAIPGTYAFRNDHLNGWHLVDFILSSTINNQHTLSLHLFNALNSQYMILPGNIGEQRSIAMQYKVTF